MQRCRIAVVGAGPAGCAAAVQCLRLGEVPVLFDRTGEAGGLVVNARSIENNPATGGPISGLEFARRMRAHLDRFRVDVLRRDIQGIRKSQERFVIDTDGEPLVADAVIVAVGTMPVLIDVAGANALHGEGIFYGLTAMLAWCTPNRILVVGGGEAACDFALSLADRSVTTTLLVRAHDLKARGHLATHVATSHCIEIQRCTRCVDVVKTPDGVLVHTEMAGKLFPMIVDAVLVAIGRQSMATSLLGPLGLSVPGLFVAGDARLGALGQTAIAVGDGVLAASAAVAWVNGSGMNASATSI